MTGDDVGFGSERFITAAFKVMSTRNLSKEVESRKKLSPDFEAMLLEQFPDRMASINTDSSNKDKSLIISTNLYNSIPADAQDLKEAFVHSHSATEYGYIQKFTMSLMSICKISTVDSEGKSKVMRVESDAQIVAISQQINSICNLVNAYISLKSEGIKDLKKIADKIKKEEKKAKDAEKEGRPVKGNSSIAMKYSSPSAGPRASPGRQAAVVTGPKTASGIRFGGLNRLASSSPSVAPRPATATTGGLRFGKATPPTSPAREGMSSPGMRTRPATPPQSPPKNTVDLDDEEF